MKVRTNEHEPGVIVVVEGVGEFDLAQAIEPAAFLGLVRVEGLKEPLSNAQVAQKLGVVRQSVTRWVTEGEGGCRAAGFLVPALALISGRKVRLKK